MCGITGIINLSGSVGDIPRHLKRMTDSIRHRGPDGEGYLFCSDSGIISSHGKDTPENVISSSFPYAPTIEVDEVPGHPVQFALGHRRLSIIDVSAGGHQPMCDPEKKIWIVYNGKIYNHVELREELKQKGSSFRTQTDTEVILQSYGHWGEDCVNHFNGMWAFVIYDAQKNILFGSRDRVGVKPFYFFRDEDVFAFASEQKALLKLPFVQSGINFRAASQFLAGDIQYVEREGENMFRNIFELMPSRNFRLDLKTKSFQQWNYYSFKANTSFSSFSESNFLKYRDETEKRLVNSVKLRLRSDVPVGSCLSGGIDSSAIVGIMGKLISGGEQVNTGGKLNVFTLQFNDPSIDESHWAKYMVDQTHAEWNLVSPSAGELWKDLRDLNYAQDIPVCSTGTYGQFRLMRSAKEKGIRVILDGQGGDELFGGYHSYSMASWRELLRKNQWAAFLSGTSAEGKFIFNAKQLIKDSLRKKFISWAPYALQESFYQTYFPQNGFLNKNIVAEYVRSESAAWEQQVSHSSSLNDALLKDFVNTRLKMYLKYEDRSSMWHSVEARTPFADDHHLAEYLFQVPGAYKIHNGVNKYLLRESMRNYLPGQIKDRKDKLGFVTPIDQWVGQIKKDALDLLDDSAADFIDVKKIKSSPDKFFTMSGHADAVRIFRTISFALWKKIFNL